MSMDSVIDERTLREIYLTGFEIAVKEAAPKSIMSAYNMVNGVYANESDELLKTILRQQWGFDGFVVTDWGGDNDHMEGVRAGSSLVMPAPGPDCAAVLVKAVRDGRIEESVLDERIRELLNVVFSTAEAVRSAPKRFDTEDHTALARKCAAEAIVLLDNDGILPLAANGSVALIGDFAATPRYQGAGSSMVNPTELYDLKTALQAAGVELTGYAQGFSRKDPRPNKKLIAQAVALAQQAQTVLLCVGLDEITESEGMDRMTMELSAGQQELIRQVCQANRNVVLVLSGGSPFTMPPRDSYRAAIHGYLGGQAGALAMADALLGVVNPSGKLNETWPNALEENPSYPYFPSKERTAEYREGLYIGYRYYDTAGVPVRYPFGYGMSYTGFAYSDLQVEGNKVSFTLRNTGTRDGAEVAQIYVSCRDGKIFRPKKELKGFQKVFLHAGEEKRITVMLDDKAFRYFNVKTGKFETETANYDILVASDSATVKLSKTVRILGTCDENPYGALPSYASGKIREVSDEEFEALLGRPIPNGAWRGKIGPNDAICQLYYARSLAARLVYKILTGLKNRAEAKGKPDLNILFIYNMPLRAIGKMSGGMVSQKMVDDIVFLVNGHFWRGCGRLIADFFRNQKNNKAFMKSLQ